jgi:hypothetical protein
MVNEPILITKGTIAMPTNYGMSGRDLETVSNATECSQTKQREFVRLGFLPRKARR